MRKGSAQLGSEFRPTDPGQLFVSNAHNTATDSGTVSAFRDSGSGRLAPIGSSPFPDLQMAPCWVEISSGGRFLFTVNTASGPYPATSSTAMVRSRCSAARRSGPQKKRRRQRPAEP